MIKKDFQVEITVACAFCKKIATQKLPFYYVTDHAFMMNYQPFLDGLANTALAAWSQRLPEQIQAGLNPQRFGDLPRWLAALAQLPDRSIDRVALNHAAITVDTGKPLTNSEQATLTTALMALSPWRKGPFSILGVQVDAEWRSDGKWQRLLAHIQPLVGRRVLDVGCGNGYYCWRMRGAGADLVVGIDPSPLCVSQFWAVQHYINDHRVSVLPLRCEQLPERLAYFDTTFSMGVFYHRRSPLDHLIELRQTLRAGGQLVLETLVIEGDENTILVPQGRYSGMPNVWFIPSCASLLRWLEKVGFQQPCVHAVTATSVQEQRQTAWMSFHSLAQQLDAHDVTRTVEGYPAPKRAIITALSP